MKGRGKNRSFFGLMLPGYTGYDDDSTHLNTLIKSRVPMLSRNEYNYRGIEYDLSTHINTLLKSPVLKCSLQYPSHISGTKRVLLNILLKSRELKTLFSILFSDLRN